MGVYGDRVLPRLTDLILRGPAVDAHRARATAGLAGDVLEVGFGSGRNLPFYPPAVRRVLAVDPADAGLRLAARRIAASPAVVEHVGLDGEHLPLGDASVDHVLTTFTLCSIPDVGAALREMRRVLRPGGTLHLLEHGRSPDGRVARWQDRLTPLQRRLAGGCHLNRPIDRLVADAGFAFTRLESGALPGPKAFTHLYEGVAAVAIDPAA